MADLGKKIQEKIESLQRLDTETAIAVRMIQLGKNPEAEIDDYVELVNLSVSLSAKIIAVANSSWCSPNETITTLKHAMTMIGTRQTRVIAVGHCLEEAHKSLELAPEHATAYWRASIAKGLAARTLMEMIDPLEQEEAYLAAMMSDLGVAVMASADQTYTQKLIEPEFNVVNQLIYEKETFKITHAQAGGMICKQLNLPDFFTRRIGDHHQVQPMDEIIGDPTACANRVVALLPHDNRIWKPRDMGRIDVLLAIHFPQRWPDADVLRHQLEAQTEQFALS